MGSTVNTVTPLTPEIGQTKVYVPPPAEMDVLLEDCKQRNVESVAELKSCTPVWECC